MGLEERRDVQLLMIDMKSLENKERIRYDNKNIVEKIIVHECGTGPYISACYVRKWYNLFIPVVRFMTNEDGIVEEISFKKYCNLKAKEDKGNSTAEPEVTEVEDVSKEKER